MPDKDKSPDWAGKGFSRRNEESAPEPQEDEDPEAWVWE